MLLGILATLAAFAASVIADCDVSSLSDSQKEFGLRVCQLETEIAVVQRALQEVLQRTDLTIKEPEPELEKRKNEFIRFGKRSVEDQKRKNEFIRFGKRKNEFIRFGKRKNEFIRFGRSDPSFTEDLLMDKRKNEFIRFG